MDFKGTEIYKNFKHKFKDKILKYIEAMYDKHSELNKVENLDERNEKACLKAGIGPKEDFMIDVFAFKNEEVNELIFEYIIRQNSNKYQTLLTNQRVFWMIQRLANATMEVTDRDEIKKELKFRTDLLNECDELQIRIDRLYSEIYMFRDVVNNIAHAEVGKRLGFEGKLKEIKNAKGN